MSRGAFALFAETSSRTADSVASFSRTLAVPLVTPGAPLDSPPVSNRRYPTSNDAAQVLSQPDTTGYVAFMRPPYQRALADVIQYYNWPRVFYIYDNSEGMMHTHYRAALGRNHGCHSNSTNTPFSRLHQLPKTVCNHHCNCPLQHSYHQAFFVVFEQFLLRDARMLMRIATVLSVRPSVRLSVCDVEVLWSYELLRSFNAAATCFLSEPTTKI